jgi:hypothetical protein
MKNPNRDTIAKLTDLPNIGKAMAEDLCTIGIHYPKELLGENPITMYETLCKNTGARHDPCVLDAFMSIVSFMEGGEPLPWWAFTPERKKIMKQK